MNSPQTEGSRDFKGKWGGGGGEQGPPGLEQGFPGGSNGKESACSLRDLGSNPGLGKASGEGNDYPPTLVYLPGEFHRQRSLVGCNPWGHKEPDATERLNILRLENKEVGTEKITGTFEFHWEETKWKKGVTNTMNRNIHTCLLTT